MVNEIENYTKLGVDKIKDVDILEKKDFEVINNLSTKSFSSKASMED